MKESPRMEKKANRPINRTFEKGDQDSKIETGVTEEKFGKYKESLVSKPVFKYDANGSFESR